MSGIGGGRAMIVGFRSRAVGGHPAVAAHVIGRPGGADGGAVRGGRYDLCDERDQLHVRGRPEGFVDAVGGPRDRP